MERYTGNDSSKRRRIARIPIEKVLTVGQEILVQVAKEPISTKGAKVTTQISLAGRFLVLVPDTDFIGVSKKPRMPRSGQGSRNLFPDKTKGGRLYSEDYRAEGLRDRVCEGDPYAA
jgi:Rne/Rng family ribonuclease